MLKNWKKNQSYSKARQQVLECFRGAVVPPHKEKVVVTRTSVTDFMSCSGETVQLPLTSLPLPPPAAVSRSDQFRVPCTSCSMLLA